MNHSSNHSSYFSWKLLCTQFLVFLCLSMPFTFVQAKTVLVSNQAEYKNAIKNVQAGDTIRLKNGVWTNTELLFSGNGTAKKPITLTAETKGKVFLTGQSNLRLAGEYLVVSGLIFKDGYTPSNEVISFRQNNNLLANHSRVTEVVIDNYSNFDRFESDYWVSLYGQYNQLDRNHFIGKRNVGVTVAVHLDDARSQQNHHKIDHNYFGPRPILGSNGGETIRIGTSHYSLSDSLTMIENNFFDRCDGEVEIISVKSGKNRIQNNVFFESRGTLTLRHGNGNVIDSNVFLGNGVDHTGGIRIINRDQTISNNYLEGLTGSRFGSGLTIMNGVYNSAINRYHQVVNANVHHNSFINLSHIELAAGSDQERTAVPLDSNVMQNLFVQKTTPFTLYDNIDGIEFKDNISNLQPTGIKESALFTKGITQKSIKLARADNGLMYPTDKTFEQYGASKKLTPIDKKSTGPSWYPKVEPVVAFQSGNTVSVTPQEDALFDAIQQAKSGDTLVLQDGAYVLSKVLAISKTITIKAANPLGATLSYQRPSLFEIQDNGSLQLDGLVINGSNSTDAAGNSVVRTKKWGMLTNYRFELSNSIVESLDVNHSFHFFDSGSRAFADSIKVTNNTFRNITGDLFRLDKENDDLGIYNVEYLTINNNEFENIEGAIAKVYRGGSDESTFGPHVNMSNNKITKTGQGKRNKSGAVLFLHGVQVSVADNNTFTNSAPIIVEHTVGEPQTRIENNQLTNTSLPKVTELYAVGEHTAKISNNKVNTL